jgi:hypothetical protein
MPITLVVLVCTVPNSGLLNVDYKALISRADLDYNEPARRSEEGMPVGNGRMGSMVWTSPTQLRFQINRVDVFAADGRTSAFRRRIPTSPRAVATWTSPGLGRDDVFASEDFANTVRVRRRGDNTGKG